MPQPLGNEQEILFRNLGLWQEKSSVLNRFNQLETWHRLGHSVMGIPEGLQVFDRIQKS